MNNWKVTSWFLLLLFSVSFISCKIQEKENVKVKIRPRPTKFLIQKLLDNEFDFEAVSTKASITFDDGKKTSFKAHLRIQKDSAIWISVTPLLGIEMARVLITQDSVMLINRASSEYFVGDFNYINELFGADLDYQMIEALLLGNSLDFEMNDKIHSAVDREKDLYFISTEKKRKVRKDLKKDKDKIKEQIQALWLNPQTFKISELLLSSSHNDNSLAGNYTNYKIVENEQFAPYNLNFILTSKKIITIEVSYNKITMSNSLTFPFNIPDKYVEIKK